MALQRSSLPTLEAGDHLTRDEFERRYAMREDIHKAELVQGVVYVPSPVKFDDHSEPVSLMTGWLRFYAATHTGARVGNDGTVRLSPVDVVQPDVMMFRSGEGAARIDADRYVEGAPELVVEVAASSAAYDLHTKKESYRKAGVKEYIVWRPLDEMIDWFRLTPEGEYKRVLPDNDGTIESSVFPGLRLNVPRMLRCDPAAILPPGFEMQG
jgi:Uma2 family endonuclease